jgi:hypothetical protein
MTTDKKHIFLADSAEPFQYSNPNPTRGGGKYPRRKRGGHAASVERQLSRAWEEVRQRREAQTAVAVPTRGGTYLEFESAPGFDFNVENLESRSKGIRVTNVRKEAPIMAPIGQKKGLVNKATVYIPEGQEGYFLDKVKQYREIT